MGSPLILTSASGSETGLYTEGFAAILAEYTPAPNPAPVEVPIDLRPPPADSYSPIRGGQKHNFHRLGYEAALGGVLLLSIGATTWYEIVNPVWSTPIAASRPAPLLHLRPVSTATLWPIESATVPLDPVRTAVADETIPATIDPILTRLSGVQIAAEESAATDSPPQRTQRPALVSIASLFEAVPKASTSSRQSPKGTVGVRPANDLQKPYIARNGEAKGRIVSSFVETYLGKLQSELENITTASRTPPEASESAGPQSGSSTDLANVGPDTGAPQPRPGADAPSGRGQGQKESKSDEPGPGRSAPNGDKPTAAAKDKAAAAGKDKSAPASKDKAAAAAKDKPAPAAKGAPVGPKADHNSNGGKPSAGKADGKGDGDKKGKPGKDKADKAKGKGPH